MARSLLPCQAGISLDQQLKGKGSTCFLHVLAKSSVHSHLINWGPILIHEPWLGRSNKPIVSLGPGDWITLLDSIRVLKRDDSQKEKQRPSAKIRKYRQRHT